mgnify:CR=1 FL=1
MSTSARLRQWAGTLFSAKRPEPSYPLLPEVRESGESNIKGLYLTGEVAGTPLIKLGLNDGVRVINRLHEELDEGGGDADVLDFLIVGAGASGLGAAMRAHELGRNYVVIEANRIAQTVVNMYKGKFLFAEPTGVPNNSSMWFEECTREVLLERWHAQIEEAGLNIREHEKVTNITRKGELFDVETDKGSFKARRVLLSVGKAGNPRKAGVPGEKEYATRVHHTVGDPDQIRGQKLFVYGGGDVACEAVLALKEHNDVTMVTIDQEFIYPKKRNADAIKAAAASGEIQLHMSSHLVSIGDGTVTFKTGDGKEHTIENNAVYEMIGAVLPLKFFKRVGIRMENTWDIKKWIVLALVFIGVYSLYALKAYPKPVYSWPFNYIFPEGGTHPVFSASGFYSGLETLFYICFYPFQFLFTKEAFAEIMKTHWFQQGYLYSFAYTVIMGVFGYQALKRWTGVARDPKYQTYRYASLLAFQIVFFLVANIVAVQALSIQHAWRAWGLYQPWPLFFNTFNWWSESDPRAVMYFFMGMGLFGTFVAIPLASYKHGKRFCTWVCGCGGLAETLGDRWRHLSAKGKRSRSWEFQGVLILVAAFIVTLICVGAYQTSGNNGWWQAYSYIVDFWLVAVIPIALYPFFGGKVWCRYWCPLAAWNGLLAGWYGRLKIKANDKCITCTLCSKYCQVGVDVMAYAKNQEAFDNSNSACIQCGICIDVCPMDVLSFDVSKGTVRLNQRALAEANI